MFSRLSDKLQDVFKDLRGHGRISESNINDALREVRVARDQPSQRVHQV
jgi:signal recognition particle subunit SRP54